MADANAAVYGKKKTQNKDVDPDRDPNDHTFAISDVTIQF